MEIQLKLKKWRTHSKMELSPHLYLISLLSPVSASIFYPDVRAKIP